MTEHDPTPTHDLATVIGGTAHTITTGLSDAERAAAEDGLMAAWALAGYLHYYAERPNLAPRPLTQMHSEAERVLEFLKAFAALNGIVVAA